MKCVLCTKEECTNFYWHPLSDNYNEHLRTLCDNCNPRYMEICSMQHGNDQFKPKPISKKEYLRHIELRVFK